MLIQGLGMGSQSNLWRHLLQLHHLMSGDSPVQQPRRQEHLIPSHLARCMVPGIILSILIVLHLVCLTPSIFSQSGCSSEMLHTLERFQGIFAA